MDLLDEFVLATRQSEGRNVEFKAVLPPSSLLAQTMGAFANDSGGYVILGVATTPKGIEIRGLSSDFKVLPITNKAIELLTPKPNIQFQYFLFEGKNLFGIKVEKSTVPVIVLGKYNSDLVQFKPSKFTTIVSLSDKLRAGLKTSTISKQHLAEHYLNILKIIEESAHKLYPDNPEKVTFIPDGKVLSRILFSSVVDNFEKYLSDLLYEIFLAKPETLKSRESVTLEEVLNCIDIDEFIQYYAKKKLLKLQRGSVRAFLSENKIINDFQVILEPDQNLIESILQIRHLYAHRNGIVDEKFLQFFPGLFPLNSEHQMSISETCSKVEYLFLMADKVDQAAISKFSLSTI
jgi:hypothetical protein